MSRLLTMDDVEAAIRGGSVFACGGGGWAEHGRVLGTAAVHAGRPELVSIDDAPDDAIIATAAAIGAPGDQTEWEMLGVAYVRAVELLQDALASRLWYSPSERPRRVSIRRLSVDALQGLRLRRRMKKETAHLDGLTNLRVEVARMGPSPGRPAGLVQRSCYAMYERCTSTVCV